MARAVILMVSGLNNKTQIQSWPILKDMNWPGILSVMKNRDCYLEACSLDQACQHALFGLHDFGPHSVFKTVDLYAKRPSEKLLFLPSF